MATKVDPPSSVEPHLVQSAVSMSTSSTASVNSPKVSMFGAKSGFVIPRNKLSGSLVPIFRGGGKVETGSTVKEESIKQVQRKTKWGADLTQDAAVRKGRALAYQTRVGQITQQLKSGALEFGDDQGSQSPKQTLNHSSPTDNIDDERSPQKLQSRKIEALELERREIIGEILRLNPTYKAPLDYKPLLKEATVSVPHKAYPGYNFLGLLLGLESNNQKRLEEETGAKVRVYGTKLDTREKHEITQSDRTEAHDAYEELYVHVSADTYEKVDAAVALIELLVTPVSGSSAVASASSSSVAGDNVNVYDPSKESASGFMVMPMTNVQGVPLPTFVPAQPRPPQFQPYTAPWFPISQSTAPSRPPGFIPAPMPNNLIRFPPSPVGHLNVPQYFGQPPPFGSAPRMPTPPAPRLHLPMQVMQQPPTQAIQPQNRPMPGQQLPPSYPVMRPPPSSTAPAPFTASQLRPTGSMPALRPPVPVNLQPAPTTPVGLPPNRPLTASAAPGNSPRWPNAPPIVPPHLRPNYTTQMTPPSINPSARLPQAAVPPQQSLPNNVPGRPPALSFDPAPNFPARLTSPPTFSSVPPPRPVSAPAMVSSSGAPPRAPMPAPTSLPPAVSPIPGPLPVSPAASAQPPHPRAVPQTPSSHISSAPAMVQASMAMPPQSLAPVMAPPPVPLASPVAGPALRPIQPPVQSPRPGLSSGSMPSFSQVKPAMVTPVTLISAPAITALKPLRPSSGDFTFQPLRAQVPSSPTNPRPNSSYVVQNTSQVPHSAPQAPSFRPAVQNPASAPPVVTQGFPRPMAPNQMVSSQAPVPPPSSTAAPFSINPASIRSAPRLPFPNTSPVPPMPPATHMALPSFSSAPQVPNLSPATQMAPPSFSPAPQGTMPAQPPSLLLPHQNQLPLSHRPSNFTPPNQQLGGNVLGFVAARPASSPGGNQIYDPFSPTSITPQQGGDPMKARNPETDAEYEDLMASVGVK